jgi:predicted RecA/RadA family phage recombinase
MKNFVQKGRNITVPAPDDIESGEVVVIDSLVGVAAGAADSGEDLDIVTEGVFELPKVETDAFSVGTTVYYDASSKLVTTDDDSGANALIGVAVTAAGNPSATVNVKIGGMMHVTIESAE